MPKTSLFDTPVHHHGYVVDNLESSIDQAVSRLGAGPFFVMRNIPLESVTSRGEPAQFLHSAAFGQWGTTVLEFMQIARCEPSQVEKAMSQPPPQLNHIAWAVPSLKAASDQLEKQGAPAFLHAEIGDIEFIFHDASTLLGHNIELHADSAGLRNFFTQIHDASQGWDGRNPIR